MSISTEILHDYLQVSRRLSEKLRLYYGKLNLTYPQSIVLAILDSDGPMPISELAESAGSANSTISGVVDRLEKLGLVQRIRSDSDRRVIYVSTTEEFQSKCKQLKNTAVDQFTQILSTLSDEETQEIRRGLSLLCHALDDSND